MTSTLIATQENPVRWMNIADKNQGVSVFMTSDVITAPPKFSKDQLVRFSGGIGIIKSCQLDSSTWTYAVEMPLSPESDVARIGSETTILLQETDIQGH